MKQWVIFDAMGVIFKVGDDVGELLVPFIRARNKYIMPQKISEVYKRASLGHISAQGFWERLGLGDAYPQIEREYLDGQLTLDDEFAKVAQELAKNYSLAMLSNDIGEWSAYLREKHGLDHYFEQVVISGDVGHRKPGNEIFAMMLERSKAKAGDCVFIDDNENNLIGAQELGIKTILFGATAKKTSAVAQADTLAQLAALIPTIL
ncbi:MAG: HAD-IA family hydrolase [Clostridia bacterium]|jgi:HAD superfamily hydrolase (TIGR01509 family)|nr:HAD-IA family hydrolase [Clostridia bacterium]MBT7122512.1 HAD-IA family hydrolase [Clostridia bacterium]